MTLHPDVLSKFWYKSVDDTLVYSFGEQFSFSVIRVKLIVYEKKIVTQFYPPVLFLMHVRRSRI